MAKIESKGGKDWKKTSRIHPVLTPRFAANLKSLRADHNMDQAVLASKVECATSYISLLENGQRSPSLEVVERFAKVFGVDPAYMLKEIKS